ncbi:uncharacterized protein LOC143793105 isoform X2 [Ranitomeya variabilis]|uniref:uncharacterized protein LOC143793105 isoform X2 n=1 Tax=Ranitomeya variabilis TaxID=490064 RepID=UPI0040565163
MEPLIQQLIQRAEEEGGAEWLRSCLAMRPAIKPTSNIEVPASPVPRSASPPLFAEASASPARSSRSPRRNRRARIMYSPTPPSPLIPEGPLPTRNRRQKSSSQKSRSPPRELHKSRLSSHFQAPDAEATSGASQRNEEEVPAAAMSAEVPSNRSSRISAAAVQGSWLATESDSGEISNSSATAAASAAAKSWMITPAVPSRDVMRPSHRQHSPAGAGLSAGTPAAQDLRLHGSGLLSVWIIGHSYVFWAEKRANALGSGGSHPGHV